MRSKTNTHHSSRLKDGVGNLSHRKLLVVSLLGRDNRCVGRKHEVDARVGNQVSLELSNIHIQCTIETKRCSQRRNDLSNQPVEVGVGRTLNVKVAAANIVESLVVKAKGTVSMLQKSMRGQDRVVGLNNSGRHLGGGRHREGELGFAAVVNREPLKEKGSKARSSSSASCMKDKESLKTGAVVSQLTNPVKDKVNNLLSNGVVTASVVVSSILLATDNLLRVVQLAVGARPHFITHSGLKINIHSTRDVLAGTSLGEESVEGIIASSHGLVRGHLAIGLDAVFKAVEFPAAIAGLDTGLAHVDRDTF